MRWRELIVLAFCGLAGCAVPGNRSALPAAPPAGEPGNLPGMEASRIRLAFGAPQFVRKDGTAQMWRYDGANCRAFFFFYPTGTALAVRHVETLPHGAEQAADPNCLQDLLARAKSVS